MGYSFTKEEVYNAYANAVKYYLTNDYKVNPEKADEILLHNNFKRKFLNNMEDYEFIEPLSVAGKLYLTEIIRKAAGRKSSPIKIRVRKRKFLGEIKEPNQVYKLNIESPTSDHI